LADLNGDGHADLLSGSWPGEIFIFRAQPDGSFAGREKLLDRNGRPIKVGQATALAVADWDSDGDLDLLVGDIEGRVFLVPNEGDRHEPLFGTPVPLAVGGTAIRAPQGDAGPCVADWDGDGKADLLLGTGSGAVLWYRNQGSPGAPELAAPQVLVPELSKAERVGARAEGGGGERPGRRTKVCVLDWNGDGRPDLLVGDLETGGTPGREVHGFVWLYLRKGTEEISPESAPSGLRP
jgi:hypothetical protein